MDGRVKLFFCSHIFFRNGTKTISHNEIDEKCKDNPDAEKKNSGQRNDISDKYNRHKKQRSAIDDRNAFRNSFYNASIFNINDAQSKIRQNLQQSTDDKSYHCESTDTE